MLIALMDWLVNLRPSFNPWLIGAGNDKAACVEYFQREDADYAIWEVWGANDVSFVNDDEV